MVGGGFSNEINQIDSSLLLNYALKNPLCVRLYFDLDAQQESPFSQKVGQLAEFFFVLVRNYSERLFDERMRLNFLEFVRNSFNPLS
jgi:hypothetical protein